jgi:basic amino acid/polyamine antiporter, APA family
MAAETGASPPRAFGFWICLALVIGNMIGSGFFLMPATLAPFGWNGVMGWLVTSAGALCLAVLFGSLARALPRAGGPYAYTRAAFGPFAAFVVAWSYWVSIWIGNVAIAIGVVAPLSTIVPAIGANSVWITLGLVWLLTAINCFGAGVAGRIQLVTTILKILPLAAVLILAIVVLGQGGGSEAPPLRAADLSFYGATGIAAAATLTLWSFLGLESATVPAERVAAPERNIPRATLAGVIVTGLLYTFVCSAVALLMPPEQLDPGAPMAAFIGRHWGGPAAIVIALFAAIAAFGTLNGWILMQGELPWAMAKDGVFPSWFAKLSRYGTPVRAHLTASLLTSAVLLLNAARTMAELFGFLILLATCATLVAYLASALAAMKLRVAPKRAWIFMLAALFSVWAIYGAGREAVLWGAALLATGAPAYFLTRGSSRAAAPARAAPAE